MSNYAPIFFSFGLNEQGAAKAMAKIDSTLGAGYIIVFGDSAIVAFHTSEKIDNYVQDQMKKAEKILKNEGVTFRKLKFKN